MTATNGPRDAHAPFGRPGGGADILSDYFIYRMLSRPKGGFMI
jgi:hypothetical protein